MSIIYLNNVDFTQNQLIQPVIHLLATAPSTPTEGQFYHNTVSHLPLFYDGTAWLSLGGRLNDITAPDGDVSLNTYKITGLGLCTSGTDAANKNYVDSVTTGATNWKAAVRLLAAANTSVTVAAATYDSVTPASGDRIALVGQTAPAENGIWVYASAGAALTRAADADASSEVTAGMAFWVTEGTVYADTAWLLTTDNPITLGSTSLTFVQYSALGQITDGAGLSKSGNTLSVNVDNSTIEISSDALRVKDAGITAAKLGVGSVDLTTTVVTGTLPLAKGGTNATSAAAAKSTLGFTTAYSADIIGDNSTTTFVITHSMNTRDVTAQVRQLGSPYSEVHPQIDRTSVNTISVIFSTAPASATDYRVTVMA